jgi:hypothetical protein
MKRFNYIILLLSLLPYSLRAQNLRIGPGTQVVVTGAPAIVLNNISLINNGHFIAGNSTVSFNGDTQAYIDGNTPISFYRLAVNLPSGELQLYNNAGVTGDITMNDGNLRLNHYTLSLGSAARIIGERNEARITGGNGGAVTITVPLNGPHAVNPGNIGVEITSNANLGPTLITRGHFMQSCSAGQTGIQRYFDIMPSFHTGAPATLRFFYFDSELGDNNKNELNLFTAPPGQNNWTTEGKDYSDGTGNWLLKSNIRTLQRFTLAPALTSKITGASVQVYPNPSRDMFTLLLFSATEKEGAISLQDPAGRTLESMRIHCRPGINKVVWKISQYAAGVYHLVFEQLDVRNTTIVKQ